MKSLFRRFAADEKGTAYIMAAFAIVPLFGMTGLAVDYANAVRTETQIETATQSVVLHLAKRTTLNPNIPAADLIAEGKGLMAEMVRGHELSYEVFEVDPANGMVRIVARTSVDTYMMHLLGRDELNIVTRKQAQFGRRDVEVAIAIDNSGSMGNWSGGKRMIDAAKDATRVLMDAASDAMDDFDNADLRFSLVPWHTHVSVPEQYRINGSGDDAWWVDWEGRSTGHFNYLAPYGNDGGMYFPMRSGSNGDQWRYYDPARLKDLLPLEADGDGVDVDTLRNLPGINLVTRRDVYDSFTNVDWNGCFEHRHGDYRFSFDPPVQDDGDSFFVPHMAPDERDSWSGRNSYLSDSGGDTVWNKVNKGNSQAKERGRVMNTAKYAISPRSIWGSGPNGKCNTAPMIALTDSRADLDDAIDDMQANGNTDLTIGLSWAMNTLTPWEPLTQAADFGEAEKILVFMTDGDNWPRSPRDYRTSYTSLQYPKDDLLDNNLPSRPSQSQANEVFDDSSKEFCTAIKNRGVRIYFVYFGNPSSAATEIMNHCATSSETAIAAADSQELEDAFRKIGDDIGKLRLSHYTPPEE
ncbi:MAG: pilus assembly protein TadG-related protein [Phyllobacteriaceae bacterium]|nr:pilus assembly protein TadG-related protein [Phyllobacteriaceae bacterium]